jgi:hypothetical protein
MHAFFTPNLVDVKYFVLGLLSLVPAPLPAGVLFPLHLVLVLVLVALVPSHIVTAPLVMLEARRRELGLPQVIHEE